MYVHRQKGKPYRCFAFLKFLREREKREDNSSRMREESGKNTEVCRRRCAGVDRERRKKVKSERERDSPRTMPDALTETRSAPTPTSIQTEARTCLYLHLKCMHAEDVWYAATVSAISSPERKKKQRRRRAALGSQKAKKDEAAQSAASIRTPYNHTACKRTVDYASLQTSTDT